VWPIFLFLVPTALAAFIFELRSEQAASGVRKPFAGTLLIIVVLLGLGVAAFGFTFGTVVQAQRNTAYHRLEGEAARVYGAHLTDRAAERLLDGATVMLDAAGHSVSTGGTEVTLEKHGKVTYLVTPSEPHQYTRASLTRK